ncbi:MAG: hypothetical protein ACLP8S_08060 [Solirubrobacteraceae bacterium]
MASHRSNPGRRRIRRSGARWATIWPAGTIACLLVSGCGSDSPASKPVTSTVTAEMVAFSKCMRGHGVSGFPDPGAVANPGENSIGGIPIPSTINPSSPAFKTAQNACQALFSARFSRQGKPSLTASQKVSLIALSQCMRTHGVPAYPDPTFPANGGISIGFGPGVNAQSPAFKQARATCANR